MLLIPGADISIEDHLDFRLTVGFVFPVSMGAWRGRRKLRTHEAGLRISSRFFQIPNNG
jgi:hypothetical protein